MQRRILYHLKFRTAPLRVNRERQTTTGPDFILHPHFSLLWRRSPRAVGFGASVGSDVQISVWRRSLPEIILTSCFPSVQRETHDPRLCFTLLPSHSLHCQCCHRPSDASSQFCLRPPLGRHHALCSSSACTVASPDRSAPPHSALPRFA
jgi:hypothetical protein